MSEKKSIQFRSIPLIMEYYREYELPSWSIMHGKITIFRYEGDDMGEGEEKLQQKLKLLQKEGSAGIYTLTLSGEDDEPLCCGFRLNEYAESYVPGVMGGAPALNEIMSKLTAMEAQIQEMKKKAEEDEEDEEDSEGDALGKIGALLENPLVQTVLMSLLAKTGALPNTGEQRPQQAVNGVIINPQDQEQKIQQAIAVLRRYDTQLGDHLLKLARVAENNPAKFKSLLMMLTLM